MIQIDMKMPEYCDDCPMLDEYGDYPMCRITQETRGYTFNTRKKRMDKCPMKNVEAVPLMHGRWMNMKNGNANCSVCGWHVVGVYDDDNADRFCRSCGAKMDLEKQDENN